MPRTPRWSLATTEDGEQPTFAHRTCPSLWGSVIILCLGTLLLLLTALAPAAAGDPSAAAPSPPLHPVRTADRSHALSITTRNAKPPPPGPPPPHRPPPLPSTPPAVPPPTPAAPLDVSAADAINERFARGRPSASLHVAGVLVHELDKWNIDDEQLWVPCPRVCRANRGDYCWCDRQSDRISSSLLNARAPPVDVMRIPLYEFDQSRHVGIVLRPNATSVLCSCERKRITAHTALHPRPTATGLPLAPTLLRLHKTYDCAPPHPLHRQTIATWAPRRYSASASTRRARRATQRQSPGLASQAACRAAGARRAARIRAHGGELSHEG
eukprot:225965-Prymnesium_polylepis.3